MSRPKLSEKIPVLRCEHGCHW